MYRHILVPTDGSERSERAAAHAADLADEHGSRITVLTVVREVDAGSIDALGTDGVERALRDAERTAGRSTVEETVTALDASSVDVAAEIVRGVPYRAICDYAESTDVDLVVMGTEGQTGLADRLLGSTTDRVTRLCDVPVLVV